MAALELEVTVRQEGAVTVVAVVGEVDAHTAPELREHLVRAIGDGHRRLVLDLQGVSFLDSSALGVLLGAHRRVRTLDGFLDLVTDRGFALKLLRITGLDTVFATYPTLDEALAAHR